MAQSSNQKKYQKHRYAEVLDAMGITDSAERQRIYTRLYMRDYKKRKLIQVERTEAQMEKARARSRLWYRKIRQQAIESGLPIRVRKP